MGTTAIVAWWGAILSTIVFLWDIYKYRMAGPKLRFTVQTGMETINMREFDGKTVLFLDVTNYGDRSTTITNLTFEYFEKKRFLPKRPDKAFIITVPSIHQPIPYELKPGTRWNGIVVQDGQIEEMAKKT